MNALKFRRKAKYPNIKPEFPEELIKYLGERQTIIAFPNGGFSIVRQKSKTVH